MTLEGISKICAGKFSQYDRVKGLVGQMGDHNDLGLNFRGVIYPLWDSVTP